jgi:hypothetical protein
MVFEIIRNLIMACKKHMLQAAHQTISVKHTERLFAVFVCLRRRLRSGEGPAQESLKRIPCQCNAELAISIGLYT